jgi:hypothetical protein
MIKNDHGKDSPAASKDEVLTRRMAMKRIALGLAGVGVAAIGGIMWQGQGAVRPGSVWDAPYSDAAREKDERSGALDAPYSDAAREGVDYSDAKR